MLWRWRGPSGHRWVWSNARGPHLEGRQEPEASSPFRTPTAGSLQSWDRRVRPRLVLGREPACISSSSGCLRPLVELCVEPAFPSLLSITTTHTHAIFILTIFHLNVSQFHISILLLLLSPNISLSSSSNLDDPLRKQNVFNRSTMYSVACSIYFYLVCIMLNIFPVTFLV